MHKHLLDTMHEIPGVFSPGCYKIFSDHIGDCVNFVETGTHYGNGVAMALLIGFEKAYSCELNTDRYRHCKERFKGLPVELFNEMSTNALHDILPSLKGKTFFWLDAHGEGGGVPTYEELDMISEYTKTATIAIDDVPVYFGDGKELEKKLLSINPQYKIKRLPTIREDYVMVAYLEDTNE
tara:strand:- start:4766 stop:5308 length:543 start_codon:yes stop_codon:yes gene_type:complete